MFKAQKRFIAGAVCPRCNGMDKMVVYSARGVDFRECVSCGFKEEMALQGTPRELDTRVNQPAEERAEDVAVVKFVGSGERKPAQ